MYLFIGPLPYHCHCYPHSPSHRKAFTQKTFYIEPFTQKILRNPRIKTLSGPLGKHSPSLYSQDSQESWDYDGGKLPQRS